MKRIIQMIMVIVLILSLTVGCEKKKEVDLYDKGLEMIEVLDELASTDGYVEMFSMNAEVKEVVKEIADNKYDSPRSVYKLEFNGSKLLDIAMAESNIELPMTVKNEMEKKILVSIPTMINSRMGIDYHMTSSILNKNELFINEGQERDVSYLFIYDDAYAGYVSFVKHDEDIISATSALLFDETLSRIDGEEALVSWFENYDLEIVKVKLIK